jgi:hypothetical protein
MQRITAQIGLAILTVALAACTGNPTGSANFIPQSQTRHAVDVGGGGPVTIQSSAVVSDVGAGGPTP